MSDKSIKFTRKTFSEEVAADILNGSPRATRAEISDAANRYLRAQYFSYQPDKSRDTFGNWGLFLRRYPNAARLAFGFGLALSDTAMPNVTLEDE